MGDLVTRDALHLVVVRSSIAHGRLTGIRIDEAAGAPGVHVVLTADDLDPMPHVPVRVLPSEALLGRSQPALATDRVRYVGQPIAAIVADDRYLAEDAAELVVADIEPLSVGDPDEPLWELAGGDTMVDLHVEASRDGAAAQPRLVGGVTGTYRIQRMSGLPMETRGLLVRPEGAGVQVWGVTKVVQSARRAIAEAFGLHPDAVICHQTDVGGMFGVRGEVYPEHFLVVAAALSTARPVVWLEDRVEHFVATTHAREQTHHLTLQVSEQGRLESFEDDVELDMGAYASPVGGRLAELVLETLPGPYDWSSFQARCRGVATAKTPVNVMRGPSTLEATFARERGLDITAHRLGLDPLELRLANLIRAEEIPHTITLTGDVPSITYDSGDFPATAAAFLEDVGYQQLQADVAARREAGELVGLGSAMYVCHSGAAVEESLDLQLLEDGSFVIWSSASEFGQGLEEMAIKVVADELDVPAARVDVRWGESRATGGRGSFSSRSTIFVGSALLDACAQIRTAAVDRARQRLPEGEVAPSRGRIRIDDGAIPWDEVAPLTAVGRHSMPEPTYGFGFHLAVVAIDPDTSRPTVERLAVGYDCGRIIDQDNARRQLVGACAQALSGTLLEDLPYSATGQPLATTFMDYRIASSLEVPPIDAFLYEMAPAPGNPLGAKGVGEAGMYGVPAAVANATAAALDLRGAAAFTDLPITAASVDAARHDAM